MDPVRLETGFRKQDEPESLIRGHVDYFWLRSTSALNIKGVIEGTNVIPYVEDEITNTYSPFGSVVVTSPIEEHPEDYAYGNLETVTVESLEK